MLFISKLFGKKKYKIIFEKDKILTQKEETFIKTKIIKVFNEFYEKEEILFFFKEIKCIIKKSNEFIMQVNLREKVLENKKLNIDISSIWLKQNLNNNINNNEIFENKLKESFKHELIHIEHILDENKKAKQSLKLRLRTISHYAMGRFEKNNVTKPKFRNKLIEFITGIYTEGMAEFFANERNQKINLKDLNEEYENNIKNSQVIFAIIAKTYSQKRDINDYENAYLSEIKYQLGLIMCKFIYLAFNLSKKDFFKLSHIKFIKKYEEAVNIVNFKYKCSFEILFSYNSGKGINNYKTILKIINSKI